MKRTWLSCIPLLLVAVSCGVSPVNYDPDDHQEIIEQSRRERTVVISLDTIFDAGAPYAVIKSAPVVLPGRVEGTGSYLYTLSGRSVMRVVPMALYGAHYVSYRFDDGGFVDTAYIGYHQSILADAGTIVRAGLLTRDGIDTVAARRFLLQHPKPPYRAPQRGDLVTRDKSQPISASRGEIRQTGVRIGRYDSSGVVIAGLPCTQITVYHVDSTICATITHSTLPIDSSASVVTARDRKSHAVRREPEVSMLETSLWLLVRQSYL